MSRRPASPDRRITLTASHTHAGRDYPPGATLTLPRDSADWLIALGRARDATEPQPPANATEPAAHTPED